MNMEERYGRTESELEGCCIRTGSGRKETEKRQKKDAETNETCHRSCSGGSGPSAGSSRLLLSDPGTGAGGAGDLWKAKSRDRNGTSLETSADPAGEESEYHDPGLSGRIQRSR